MRPYNLMIVGCSTIGRLDIHTTMPMLGGGTLFNDDGPGGQLQCPVGPLTPYHGPDYNSAAMGFNKRRMESDRKAVAAKETAVRRALSPQGIEDASRGE